MPAHIFAGIDNELVATCKNNIKEKLLNLYIRRVFEV